MGIVYHKKIGKSYKNTLIQKNSVSQQKTSAALTRENIQFLKSIGLRLKNIN